MPTESLSFPCHPPCRSMGTAARHINREVHADVGYAHLDIPRLELVVWPRGKPAAAANVDSSGGGSSAAAEGAASSGEAELVALPAGGSGLVGGSVASPASSAASISAAAAADEHLPEYLRGEASGGTAVASRGSSGGRGSAGRRKAALQQLNTHVACLSGRWWETFGSGSSQR